MSVASVGLFWLRCRSRYQWRSRGSCVAFSVPFGWGGTSMIPSVVFRTGLAALVVWWGVGALHTSWSAAQVQESTQPAAAKSEVESQAGEVDAEKRSAVELTGLR